MANLDGTAQGRMADKAAGTAHWQMADKILGQCRASVAVHLMPGASQTHLQATSAEAKRLQ
eukprot:4481012-Karenia_brevis.AAC.1